MPASLYILPGILRTKMITPNRKNSGFLKWEGGEVAVEANSGAGNTVVMTRYYRVEGVCKRERKK